MSKGRKILIGVLTILPGFCFAAYILLFMLMFFGIMSHSDPSTFRNDSPPEGFMTLMPSIFLVGMIGGLLTIIMTIYHVIHINSHPTMSSNDKLVWILVVIFFNWIGDAIYWYIKIWKEDSLSKSQATPQ